MIRAFEYSSAEFLLKYQSKYFVEDDLYDNVLRSQTLKNKFRKFLKRKSVVSQTNFVIDSIMNIEKRNFEKRLIKLNEMRDLTLDKKIKMNENITQKTAKNKSSLKSNDLIKLRRLKQNQQKSHKLKSK